MGLVHTVFLDACAIIYWIEASEPWYGSFQQQLKKLQQTYEDIEIAISDLSRLECLVKPLRENQAEIVKLYEAFFDHPDLTIQTLTPAVIERALKVRVEYKLKTPDCIQAACALHCQQPCSFITADKSFSVIDDLHVVLLEDHLAAPDKGEEGLL